MNLQIIRRNAILLDKITQNYLKLLKKKGYTHETRRMEEYIESLLINIEKNTR
jgi:hypothetical protein